MCSKSINVWPCHELKIVFCVKKLACDIIRNIFFVCIITGDSHAVTVTDTDIPTGCTDAHLLASHLESHHGAENICLVTLRQ